MTILGQVLLALLLGVIFSVLIIKLLRRPGPGPGCGILFFLPLLFLATWSASLWIGPVGPRIWGIHWLVFLITGFLIALFVAAIIPPLTREGREPQEQIGPEGQATDYMVASFGILFYVVLLLLLVSALLAYWVGPFTTRGP